MLRADGKAHGGWRDVLLRQLFRTHLRVGGGVRMDDKALHIRHIRQQGENLQGIDELPRFLLASIYLEGEDAARPFREILPVEGRSGREGWFTFATLGWFFR